MESRKKSNKKKLKKSKTSWCTKPESLIDKTDGLSSSINDIDDFSLLTGAEGATPGIHGSRPRSKNDLKKVYAAVYGDDSSDADEGEDKNGKTKIDAGKQNSGTENKKIDAGKHNNETDKKKIDAGKENKDTEKTKIDIGEENKETEKKKIGAGDEENKETEKKDLDTSDDDDDDDFDEDDSDWTTDDYDEYFDCDSDDDTDDDDNDSSEEEKNEDTASKNSTKDGKPFDDITSKFNGLSIDGKSKKTASVQTRKPEECSYCKKTGEMKTCGRCNNAKYCDAECQKKDFKDHKAGCKNSARLDRFKDLLRRQCMPLMMKRGMPCSLKDVDFDEASLLDCTPLIVEIVARIFHPFRIGLKVVDMFGETASLYFYNKEDTFTVWQKQGPAKVPKRYRRGQQFSMQECAVPGNFILVYLPLWHYFADGSVGFRMDEGNDFEFLFPFPK